MLRQLAENLWVAERPHRFYGLEVGSRMTVIRLGGGELFLHSPLPMDSALRRELDELGPVRYAVAPNRFHHLYAGEVTRAYPEARLWVAPGLESKRPDLPITGVLGEEPVEAWANDITHLFVRGRPMENEVVFLHRPSRTLILCDLAFNFGRRTPALTRVLLSAVGAYGHFATTKLDRFLVRDRDSFRRCIETVLSWDFDRIVVAHGEILESGGPRALRRAYDWL